MKPHGRDCPDRCSICAGIVPRKVEQQADQLVIDGEVVRAIHIDSPMQTEYAKRRGRGRR